MSINQFQNVQTEGQTFTVYKMVVSSQRFFKSSKRARNLSSSLINASCADAVQKHAHSPSFCISPKESSACSSSGSKVNFRLPQYCLMLRFAPLPYSLQVLAICRQASNAIKKHSCGYAVIFIIIENTLPNRRIPSFDPAMIPYYRVGS